MSKAKAGLGWRLHTQRKARKHLERARSYARSVRWILYDLVAFVRWRLLGIVGAGAGYILTKFAAMGVIYLGVHALSNDHPIHIPWGVPLEPRSQAFLALTVGCGVGLLSLSTALRYWVRRQSIWLSRHYLELCMRRVMAIASRLPDPRAPEASRLIGQDAPHVFLVYARFCGWRASSCCGWCRPSPASSSAAACCCGSTSGSRPCWPCSGCWRS